MTQDWSNLIDKITFLEAMLSEQKSKLESPLLTRKEAADYFRVSLNTIDNWSRSGRLKKRKMGKRSYFLRSECYELMNGE